MAYTAEDFYFIFSSDLSTVEIPEHRYSNWCWKMDKIPELIGNKDIKNMLKAQRKNILKDDKEHILAMLKIWREKEKTPKDHYWWWLDKL